MSEVKLTINGLDELRRALLQLPAELVREAGPIVAAQAEYLASLVRSEYSAHQKTGNLLRHLKIDIASDAVSATARVSNNAHHAHIFEKGTVKRNYNGANRGVMPAARSFIPTAIIRRRVMVEALVELVERAGLTVT